MPTHYSRTTAGTAEAILDSGFRDRPASFDVEIEGVWLSDVPLDGNDADRDTLLTITLDDQDLIDREVVEEGVGSYREWLVPAAAINARGKVRLVSADEEEEAASRRFDLADDSKDDREGG
jgi:hypothetical protein